MREGRSRAVVTSEREASYHARRPRPCCSSSWKALAERGELREVVAGGAQVSAGCVAAFCVVLALRQADSVGKQKEVWRRGVEAE